MDTIIHNLNYLKLYKCIPIMFSHSHELQGDPHKGAVFASAQRCHQQQRQAIDSVDSFFFWKTWGFSFE
jgi:hypothetical protein